MNRFLPALPLTIFPGVLLASILLLARPAAAQTGTTELFNNLARISPSENVVSLSSPQFYNGCYPIGPKEGTTADFDGDGFADVAVSKMEGAISVVFWDQATRAFTNRRDLLHASVSNYDGTDGYRGVAALDLNQDGRPEVMAISPYRGNLYIHPNLGGRNFGPAGAVPLWYGARDCAVGDFNGDGIMDLIVGGGDYSTGRYSTLNYRVLQLRGDGLGGFVREADLIFPGSRFIMGNIGFESSFPKPVFSFAVYRPAGAVKDSVVATHAMTNVIWFLAPNAANQLAIIAQTTAPNPIYHLEVAELRSGIAPSAGLPALVAATNENQKVYFTSVNPPAISGAAPLLWPWASLDVPGGPRAVKIADFNGDGRKDLLVVVRNFHLVNLYTQDATTLTFTLASQYPVGRSPRDLIVADINGNGKLDAVVLCRQANLLTVLKDIGGPSAPRPGLYPGSQMLTDIMAVDLNNDGRDDLVYLDAVKQLLVSRISNADRSFGPPRSLKFEQRYGFLHSADVNGDGFQDVLFCDTMLRRLYAALSNAAGELQLPVEIVVPLPPRSVHAADLDGDNLPDLILATSVGSLICMKNLGQLRFGPPIILAVPYAKSIAVADFDQDGDNDVLLDGAIALNILRNDGNLVSSSAVPLYIESVSLNDSNYWYPNDSISLTDLNGDADPDVIFGTSAGFVGFAGGPGLTLTQTRDFNPQNAPVATGSHTADFDRNGFPDVVTNCPGANLIAITSQFDTPPQIRTQYYEVLGSNFVIPGDFDGDGKPDIMGGADFIWVAYSSGLASIGDTSAPSLPIENQVVINEILAVNDSVPVSADGGRTTDFVEFYNGAATPASLTGWKLEELADGAAAPQTFAFPAGQAIPARGRLVVVFSSTIRSPLHAGFRLTGDGSLITLKNAAGVTMDSVKLGKQRADIAFSRPTDGYPGFVKNIYPDPGLPNAYNGAPGPELSDVTYDAATAAPNTPIVFRAKATGDFGVSRVQVVYRIFGGPLEVRRVTLFDDGLHGDGAANDGNYAGALAPGLAPGAQIEFFYEAADVSNRTTEDPDTPLFTLPGRQTSLYSLAIPNAATPVVDPLEISEVVSNSSGVLADEAGDFDDYIEIRNTTSATLDLTRYSIRSNLVGSSGFEFFFPSASVLQPGQTLVLWADGEVDEGPYHLPFSLNKNGDELYVFLRSASTGSNLLASQLGIPELKDNTAYLRLGPGGIWTTGTPSPGRANADSLSISAQADAKVRLLFPTRLGKFFTLQVSDTLSGAWLPLLSGAGDNFERFWEEPASQPRRFFRIVESP